MAKLRIGSRGSQLAQWQANHVSDLLRRQGHSVELEIIKTTGDKITEVALAQVGTKGMFTKEIEEALDDRRIDLAVHSLKDLPTELASQFLLAAVMKRQDARDVFLSLDYAKFRDLPRKARVGTSSLRRQAQLKAVRPDLQVFPLRGNVDTRLRKLEEREYQAIILAAAGLNRLGRTERVREAIPVEVMCPAVGQGALGIECRSDDFETKKHLEFLDDAPARRTTAAERALLRTLGGGCQVPIGAHGELVDGGIRLTAIVARPDGSELLREQQTGKDPEELGERIGRALLQKGAEAILRDVYCASAAAPQQP
jgi:hydroxymethylbilane synthase